MAGVHQTSTNLTYQCTEERKQKTRKRWHKPSNRLPPITGQNNSYRNQSPLPLEFLWKKKGKPKKKFCRGMKFTEQTTLVCFIESSLVYWLFAQLWVVVVVVFLWRNNCLLTSQQTQNHMVQLGPEAHNSSSHMWKTTRDFFLHVNRYTLKPAVTVFNSKGVNQYIWILPIYR